MARGRPSVLKRQRERQKAEKAARKREERNERGEARDREAQVATAEDLAGYGLERTSRDDERGGA